MGRMQDKVAFITGGASGMGEMMVNLFTAEGAKVIAADINTDALKAKWDTKENVEYLKLNVTDADNWEEAMKTAEDKFGQIDILINCAGISTEKAPADITLADWQRLHDINSFGTYAGMRAVVPYMKKAGKGSIVNISSYTALVGMGFNPYSASKGSVRAISRAAAAEFGKDQVRVNTVFPGVIQTPMVANLESSKAALEGLIKMTPLARLGQPEDVGNAVMFLASDEASYITGAELVIDGGFSAR
ncbi:SDR family oxidoreductase [Sporosarcina jeotgali]|uniref:SDR family oxidoreductase n=1 Tax=Sporosarcina jeotgali TaxID=3020056 RepID=A0ABZ0KZA3_9BACL|nr:SDR family oxidoreductase [Sporosarcina sp. B2O-1]WOV84958.1 SDR family oxidoreductase [Sporosarcina sp. B2O-1]